MKLRNLLGHITGFLIGSKLIRDCIVDDCYAKEHGRRISQSQINYEKRIKKYSPPMRIFEYFASVRIKNTVLMSVDDFVASIANNSVSCLPNSGFGKFKYFGDLSQAENWFKRDPEASTDSGVLCQIYKNDFGIQFFEYLLFRLILNASSTHLKLLFELIDLDGNGEISCDEFSQFVMLLMQVDNASNTLLKLQVKSADITHSKLADYLFGNVGIKKHKLSKEDMLKFQWKLLDDLTRRQLRLICDDRDLNDKTVSCRGILDYFAFQVNLTQSHMDYVKETLLSGQHVENLDQRFDIEDLVFIRYFLLEMNSLTYIMKTFELMNADIDIKQYEKLLKIHMKNCKASNGKSTVHSAIISILFHLMDANHNGITSAVETREFFNNFSFHSLNREFIFTSKLTMLLSEFWYMLKNASL